MSTLKYGLSAAAAGGRWAQDSLWSDLHRESFYHREYIDFHRKTLKPLKIVLGNRTPCSREGISAALRASCVLIVCSNLQNLSIVPSQNPFIDSLKGQSGSPWPCQRFKAGLKPAVSCWRWPLTSEGKGQGWFWLCSLSAKLRGSIPVMGQMS